MNKLKEAAKCRGCGTKMQGDAYMYGNNVFNHKVNHYGGYVCSRNCDFNSSLDLETSMPGHRHDDKSLGCFANKSLINNWDEWND